MRLAPDASLTDGLLDIVVIGAMPRSALPARAPKVFPAATCSWTTSTSPRREVRIAAERPFELYADGDPIATAAGTRAHAARRDPRARAGRLALRGADRARSGATAGGA